MNGEVPVTAAVLFLALCAASGQGQENAFERRHGEALAANREDVAVELKVRGGRTRFFQGEVIRLELWFSSTSPQRYELDGATYDRRGRMSFEKFHVEPAGGAVDPLRGYFASLSGFMGGGLRGMSLLDEEPEVIELVLNEWLRFDRPGDYRLFVTTRRLEDLTAEAGDRKARRVEATTGMVELVILPAQPGWAQRALAQARGDLDSGEADRRETGCVVLRHLGTEPAIAELVRESARERQRPSAGDCRADAGLGLYAHPDRRAVVGAMEAHLDAPGGVLDASFLHRLARLAWLAENPPPAEGAEIPAEYRVAARSGFEQRSAAYVARLAGALEDKEGPARAAAMTALLETAIRLPEPGAVPDLDLGALRPMLAEHFGDLPPARQARLLDHRWAQLRDPSFRPVLLRLYESPPELPWIGGSDLRDLAVRRLHDLDPAAAREILLADMRRPRPRLQSSVLELIPDAELPPAVEAAVVENLRSSGPGRTDLSRIVGRYGSAGIQGAIKEIYDRGHALEICWQAPFLAYFLRVDSEAGAEELRQFIPPHGDKWRSLLPPPGWADCQRELLGEVAAFGYSPAFESVVLETLSSGEPKLETAAAEVLGRHGTASAEAPLWRRLERWHQEWKERPEELRYDRVAGRPNAEAVELESALVRALSEGAGWVADRSALARLETLCLSDQRKREVQALAARESGQPKIVVYDLAKPSFGVAQYQARSVAALKARLAQFPEGTVFRWQASSRNADPAAAEALFVELETWLAEQGRGLVR